MKNNKDNRMKYFGILTCLLAILFAEQVNGQYSLYDPDIQSFTAKGDSFYVEREIISMTKHRKIKPGDSRIYTWVLGGQIQSNQGGLYRSFATWRLYLYQ